MDQGALEIWLSLPVGELAALICVAVTVFVRSRGITVDLDDWLGRDNSKAELPELSLSINSLAEVAGVAEKIATFCSANGGNTRTSYHLQLCVEEFVYNIAEREMTEKDRIDVNIVVKDGRYVTQIWDTTNLFDPMAQLDQFDESDPCKNIGIKIVSRLATEMTYMPQFGMNIVRFVL